MRERVEKRRTSPDWAWDVEGGGGADVDCVASGAAGEGTGDGYAR